MAPVIAGEDLGKRKCSNLVAACIIAVNTRRASHVKP
jgi:hypothetical protein